MRYIPVTPEDVRNMLDAIGLKDMQDLFSTIPQEYQYRGNFSFPGALSEQELTEHLWELSSKNQHLLGASSFLGGGAYNHYVPALVDALISRGEFMTSYTPYQPEISQGTLQAIFEFQTYICQLTGLDIANASMYDGASSAAETVLMARRIHPNRRKVLVSSAVNPNYRRVIDTYTTNLPLDIVEVPFDEAGRTDRAQLEKLIDGDTACVVLQSPNYFGVIEDNEGIFALTKKHGAVAVSVVAEALSMAALKSPGDSGADLCAGESQSFGLPVAYGGPYAGFLSVRQNFMRSMPGRLVGAARDRDGRRGFVLTLAAREQHIRREKATSNICTNQGLCALAVTIYLSFVGGIGLKNLAVRNMQISAHAKESIRKAGKKIRFSGPTFNEFVVEGHGDAEKLVQKAAKNHVYPGIPLGRYYKGLENCLLVCCTEMTRKQDIEKLVSELEAF